LYTSFSAESLPITVVTPLQTPYLGVSVGTKHEKFHQIHDLFLSKPFLSSRPKETNNDALKILDAYFINRKKL
jgi:hypothetical protein